jgi:isoamylase
MSRLLNTIKIKAGYPHPLGLTKKLKGLNFALFSKHATNVSLCFFEKNNKLPIEEISLDNKVNKTGDIWHILIESLPQNLEYAYRIKGPYNKEMGHLFSDKIFVCDPKAKYLSWGNKWSEKKLYPPKAKLCTDEAFEWNQVAKPNIAMQDLIIYEMHVRGFTKDDSSKVLYPGTFSGIIEKIPYLKELGVNAIELLPIFEFDECANEKINPFNQSKLYNYWGYSPINFYALTSRYSANIGKSPIYQFKELVKELHKNNIEIFLDVVYNHTAEGDDKGKVINFKGIDNSIYYLLDEKGNYINFSGCGNTINCNNIVVREHILNSLRYWVSEMQVDGFRFDLASILTRDSKGNPLECPPLIESISLDPIFAETKLIAEAWDSAGLYQVGSFPSWGKWMEWNGKFRDSTRMYLNGNVEKQGDFATYFLGSKDLYGDIRNPYHSVNFITCHDGFSMFDLLSYEKKYNEINGENNRDGIDENHSWNCGFEGETNDENIKHLRKRQLKNYFFSLLLAQGTPMISMGDEYAHTKKGNNNSWCQDNEINWFQWELLSKNNEIFCFVKKMIKYRKENVIIGHREFLDPSIIEWHSNEPLKATWDNPNGLLALTLKTNNSYLYFGFNPTSNLVEFKLPKYDGKSWYKRIDTYLESPLDFEEKLIHKIQNSYLVNSNSCILLEAIY